MQIAYVADQCEVERFFKLIRAVFSSGNAHIACRLKQEPPKSRPFAWGWRDDGASLVGEKQYKPMGDCIGWFYSASEDNLAEVWLEQETAYKVVQQFAKAQGEPLLISPSTLWRRMIEKGLILKTEKDPKTNTLRPTVKRTVAGRSIRVMVLSAELIESG